MTFLLVLATATAIFMALALALSTFERVARTPGNASLVPLVLIVWVIVVSVIVFIGFGTGDIEVWLR